MAKCIKGEWAISTLQSEETKRPAVALLFTLDLEQTKQLHAAAGAAILHSAAAELAQELAVYYGEVPVTVFPKPFQQYGNTMVGAVVIEWCFASVPKEADAEYVKTFMAHAADFLTHLSDTPHHHTIVVVDTEEEAERMFLSETNDRVVSIKSRHVVPATKPDPVVNSLPPRGVN